MESSQLAFDGVCWQPTPPDATHVSTVHDTKSSHSALLGVRVQTELAQDSVVHAYPSSVQFTAQKQSLADGEQAPVAPHHTWLDDGDASRQHSSLFWKAMFDPGHTPPAAPPKQPASVEAHAPNAPHWNSLDGHSHCTYEATQGPRTLAVLLQNVSVPLHVPTTSPVV